MAYEADVHALAEHLAHLLAAEHPVDPDELAVVDAARAAVRQLCWRILHDVAAASLGESPIADLGHRSVASLQHVLRAEMLRFADPAQPSTGWVDHASSTPVRHHWRGAHRFAALAEHEWEMIYPEAHPHGPDAWPIITDIAAIAEAIAHLELNLARQHPKRTTTVIDQAWALAFAAEQVRRLAPLDTLDADPAPLPSRRHQLLLRIRSAADAPAGTARLTFLLRSAHHLEPATVRAVARSQAQALRTIGRLLKADPHYGPAEPRLRALANALAEVARQTQRIRTTEPGDYRPRQQLQLLHDCWRFLEKPHEPTRAERAAAARTIRPALDIVAALRDVIEQHVHDGRWYQYLKGARHPWRLTSDTTQPRIVETAQRAVEQADLLARALPSTGQPEATIRAPRHLLSPSSVATRLPPDRGKAPMDATR
ncbi:hypothetical protein [Jiangella alba]|uniref:Uncharacterized protein n=1 Tax=Jiangella alba TaxID=561176 RepID=A0A1H5N236_9ACTN|nr:hypothetical protein [Jiangella alba]SEE94718.1 hypothetical protein SAMN04488561_3571 [Jiangella alba]